MRWLTLQVYVKTLTMLPITITGNIDEGFPCQRQQNTKCLEPVNEKHTKAPLRICGYGRIGQR